jgi:hypothetical protein
MSWKFPRWQAVVVCELFLLYLRGVSFARVIVSRNGNIPIYKSALFDVHMFDDEDTFDPQ